MRHLFSTRLRVILIVGLLLSAGLAILSNATQLSLPNMLVQGFLAPFKAGANALTTHAENFYGYIFKYESLSAENEALKAQIAEMQNEARQADAYQRENQRLKKLLDFLSSHDDYVSVDAYIIGRDSTDWSSELTINKGTDAGIYPDMCAITANGEVVGLVVEAGSNYAVIKTVLDSSLEISGTIASTGHNGMVQGGYTSGRKDLLRMDYLPSSSIIRNKDEVVTSGSTVYPRNLILGYVVDAGFDETGVAKYAILEPATDIAALEQIFVITQYQVVTDRPSEDTGPTEAAGTTEPQDPMGGVG